MIRSFCLLAAIVVATAAGTAVLRGGSYETTTPPPPICDRIQPLPEECACREGSGPHSLVVECLKHFNGTFFNDTIGLKLVVEPCSELGSSVSLDITDVNYNIDYPIEKITAGESKIIPIPGLSIVVPQLGHLGIDAVVYIAGNPDLLILKVGLDACLAVRSKFVCAESLPGLDTAFPWWVMNGTYHFGDMCNSTAPTAAAVTIS